MLLSTTLFASGGCPNHGLLERIGAIEMPVFVANGDSDPMILPRYSYLLAGLLPDARLKIYPDAAHGFLFQHHSEFAADVSRVLGLLGGVTADPRDRRDGRLGIAHSRDAKARCFRQSHGLGGTARDPRQLRYPTS